MCGMCMKDGCCCKAHMAMKGVAMLILAAIVYAIEAKYIGLSYGMLIAIVLAVIGIKKLVLLAMWKDNAPKKKKK